MSRDSPRAARLGDMSTGHDACVPVPIITASPDVFINGLQAARVSDSFAVHGCVIHPPHSDVIAAGSATVFVNGLPAARKGDPVIIGGVIAEGSDNVWIG